MTESDNVTLSTSTENSVMFIVEPYVPEVSSKLNPSRSSFGHTGGSNFTLENTVSLKEQDV